MPETEFSKLAQEAKELSKEGLNLLIEIDELQNSIKNVRKNKDYQKKVEEIVEKEKYAVGLISKATIIQRSLMKKQHESIENILSEL